MTDTTQGASVSGSNPTSSKKGADRFADAIAKGVTAGLDARDQRDRDAAEKKAFDDFRAGRKDSRIGVQEPPKQINVSGGAVLGVAAVVLLAMLVIVGNQNGWFSASPTVNAAVDKHGRVASANPAVSTAPTAGSKLPSNMVPGEWYATGNTKSVPQGTVVDTTPKPCVRNGEQGMCGLKKRGS